jgi:hypothetical protein
VGIHGSVTRLGGMEGARETKLAGGTCLSVVEKRKGAMDERHKPEEKAPF